MNRRAFLLGTTAAVASAALPAVPGLARRPSAVFVDVDPIFASAYEPRWAAWRHIATFIVDGRQYTRSMLSVRPFDDAARALLSAPVRRAPPRA